MSTVPERVCAGRETVHLTPAQSRRYFKGVYPQEVWTGTRACAYPIDGEVVKFTLHDRDAAAALAVKARPVPGVIKILGVDRPTPYHYAIRSRREQRPGPVASLVQRCANLNGLGEAFTERFQGGYRGPAPIPLAVSQCIRREAPRAGVSAGKAQKFARDLSKLQARLSARTGVHWFDVYHPGNFTQDAAGRPVLIDLGASMVPKVFYDRLRRQRVRLSGGLGAAARSGGMDPLERGLGIVALVGAVIAVPVALAAVGSLS